MAETRYHEIRTEEGNFPRIIHECDQFSWYWDAMRRIGGEDDENQNPFRSFSAVRFSLPSRAERANYLVVAGDMMSFGEVYLIEDGTPYPSAAANTDMKLRFMPAQMNRLFSYNELKREGDGKIRKELPLKLGHIFTTEEKPFLRRGEYPLEADREYWFGLGGFDQIKLVAHNRKDSRAETLDVIYSPDHRDGKDSLVTTLHQDQESRIWVSDLKSQKRIETWTFPNAVNA